MKHDLHIIVSRKQFEQIEAISVLTNQSFSEIIRNVVDMMIPFLLLNWMKAKNRKCKYKILDIMPKERFDIHSYVDESIYQIIKQIHKDLDFYSMGQIVREVLKYFFYGAGKYGYLEFLDRLEKCKIQWEEKLEKLSKKGNIFRKHMRNVGNEKPFFQTIYSRGFEPIQINFLQKSNSS